MVQDGGVSYWSAPTTDGPVHATVSLPGSKSITNRALILASLAEGTSRISGALRSRDTNLMINGLRALGVSITGDDSELVVESGTLRGGSVDCGLAGTVMRFLPPLAALAEGKVVFDGDEQARLRPLGVILEALRVLGVQVSGNALPFTVCGIGTAEGGHVEIDASGSSQFVSGLLLSGARYRHGVTVRHIGRPVPSMPHIEMTLAMLRRSGVQVSADSSVDSAAAPDTWRVQPGPVQPVDWVVEPDLSNATPFLAAAAVTGGRVTVPHWPETTTQPGDAIRDILQEMGAEVRWADGALTVAGPDELGGVDIDLHDIGELAPTVAALAALAAGPSRLRGIAHLRGHETDRLAALSAEINALGGKVAETEDGLTIEPASLRGGTWHSYADHRMATAGAILGLRVPDVMVEDIGTTGKTLPGFESMWARMLATGVSS